MSGLTGQVSEREFAPLLIGVDDNKDDLYNIKAIAEKYSIKSEIFTTIKGFAERIKSVSADDIIVTDNYNQGTPDLGIIGYSSIKTKGGVETGLALLTTYCDILHIEPGLKLLVSQYSLKDTVQILERRRAKNKDNLWAFNKSDLEELERKIQDHVRLRREMFIKDKIRFVKTTLDEWKLSSFEQCSLFGVVNPDDPFWRAMFDDTTSLDVEARCDLIYRLKIGLDHIFGDDIELQARWFRASLVPYDGLSPLEFVRPGYQHKLAELVFRLEGPA